MNKELQDLIVQLLIQEKEYFQRVYPNLKEEYFTENKYRLLFREFQEYAAKYSKAASKDVLYIEIQNRFDFSEDDRKAAATVLDNIGESANIPDIDWAVNQTEEFCRLQAIFNAARDIVVNLDDAEKHKNLSGSPQLLQEALAVSFDPKVGHEFLEEWEDRFEAYHSDVERIPFHIKTYNDVTKGGCPRKTLNVVVAGTNQFKSGWLCDYAASQVMLGRNVLYISMEMSREMIGERIDANMMDRVIDDVKQLDYGQFERQIGALKNRTKGRLFVEEYPTGTASALHFKALCAELVLKKRFKPDIIVIDYMTICASSRVNAQSGMYDLNKKIAEELRGLAVEMDAVVWTAAQTNRGGQASSDVSFDDIAESHGISMTADFMIALYASEELAEQNLMKVVQIKSRYDDVNKKKVFLIGVNKDKMKTYPHNDDHEIVATVQNRAASAVRPKFNFDEEEAA